MALLDTCTLLWLVADQKALSRAARTVIEDPVTRLHVTAISAFEIGIKHRRGALKLPLDPVEWYQQAIAFHGLTEIPVDGRIAALSTQLPPLHADPADRIIVATAQIAGLPVITPDRLIKAYPGVKAIW